MRVNPATATQGVMYLTPVSADDECLTTWPEWDAKDIGVVLPSKPGQMGIYVMTPGGSGVCFFDEIIEIK